MRAIKENEVRYLSALTKDKNISVRFPDDGYIAVDCTRSGVRMRAVSEKPETGFVVRYDTFGSLRLPGSIIRAYRLDEEAFPLVTIDRGKEYLIDKKCDGEIPKPFIGNLNYDKSELNVNDYVPIESKRGFVARITTTSSMYVNMPVRFDTAKVTVHMGECLRIDVEMPTREDRDTIPYYKDLREEYKSNLANFCGEQITYLCELTSNTSIRIPKPFRIAARLEKGDEISVYRKKDNPFSYMFAPPVTACEFCGKEVDPRKEVPKETLLCPDCDKEPESYSDVVKMVREIKDYADKVIKRAKSAEESASKATRRAMDAERRAKSAEESNDKLIKRLSQLEEESLSDKEKLKAITALIAGGAA